MNKPALFTFCAATLSCLLAACGGASGSSDLDETDAKTSELGKGKNEGGEAVPGKPVPAPVDCSAKDACGPAPGMASQTCSDGTVAGATCVDVGGSCGWKFTECPSPPPGSACGDSVCGAKQTCCDGMPFTKPTCVDGTMCPISQRQHKKDIAYLSESEKQQLTSELLGFRLATYRYKTETAKEREHLGFIIDDVAPSPAVTPAAERVDMYGYATMSVAALQVQAREIAELRAQIVELKREVGKTRAPGK